MVCNQRNLDHPRFYWRAEFKKPAMVNHSLNSLTNTNIVQCVCVCNTHPYPTAHSRESGQITTLVFCPFCHGSLSPQIRFVTSFFGHTGKLACTALYNGAPHVLCARAMKERLKNWQLLLSSLVMEVDIRIS